MITMMLPLLLLPQQGEREEDRRKEEKILCGRSWSEISLELGSNFVGRGVRDRRLNPEIGVPQSQATKLQY